MLNMKVSATIPSSNTTSSEDNVNTLVESPGLLAEATNNDVIFDYSSDINSEESGNIRYCHDNPNYQESRDTSATTMFEICNILNKKLYMKMINH